MTEPTPEPTTGQSYVITFYAEAEVTPAPTPKETP